MPDNKKTDDFKAIPFEKALERLEGVVEKMEEGNLSLEKMIACFEEGNALSSACHGKLKKLERKIEILVKKNDQEDEWRDFEGSSNGDESSDASDGDNSKNGVLF